MKRKSNKAKILEWLDKIILRWRRSRLRVTNVTLRRSGMWTEVVATVNGEEILLIREIYENNFHHTITSTGMTYERYQK